MEKPMFSFADDEEIDLTDSKPEAVASEEFVDDFKELSGEVESAQRLVVSRLLRKYVKGRMESAMPDPTRGMSPQKMFNIEKLIEWVDGEPESVIEGLQMGRLRVRLSAAMGTGKSTKLASFVAKAMDMRVLHVALDAHALQQVGVYIKQQGIGFYSRNWSKTKKAHVCCMTYADFNGYMGTTKRAELFRSFDLIIFDEAFVDDEDVFVAGAAFSVYASADINLIICSATIRKDVDSSAGGSKAMGVFRVINPGVDVPTAIASGKLVADYLVDKTMTVAPNDQKVHELEQHYIENGVDVKALDSASTYEEMFDCEVWLQGDATVPRVMVVHHTYAIAFNFIAKYQVLFPYETVNVIEDNVISEKDVFLTEEMVTQAKARTGRGIVDGSGGCVMSNLRSASGVLPEYKRMAAFVKLCAVSIKPLRTKFWEKCYQRFPDALTPMVAHTILKICLPVEVAARYLCQDGRVAKKFCTALNCFSQPDHFLMASAHEYPLGYDKWECEPLLYRSDESNTCVKVPYKASGEIQIILQGLELMSRGDISVARWRPSRFFSMGDGYDSSEEEIKPRHRPMPKLRRPVSAEWTYVEEDVTERQLPWSYRPQIDVGPVGGRQARYIDSDRFREAMIDLENSLLNYTVPKFKITEVQETDEGTVVPLVVEGLGDVESPGGSVICTLPAPICEKMNEGKVLKPDEFLKVVTATRSNIDRFVASKVFDSFSGPWTSFLESLRRTDVASLVVKKGVASDTYAMVDGLRGRFGLDLSFALSNSNVYKRKFLKVFHKVPSMDETMSAIRRGRFDRVAQTDGFLNRVKYIKETIDQVLLHAESAGIYLPNYITQAQRRLPFRGQAYLGYVDDNLAPMPGSWKKQLESRSHTRSISDGSKRLKNAGL